MDLYVHTVRNLWTRLAYVKKDLLHIFFLIFGDGLQLELLTSTKLLSFILNDLRLMILHTFDQFCLPASFQAMTRFCMSLYVYEFSPGVRGNGYITNQNGETTSFWFLNNNILYQYFIGMNSFFWCWRQ